jgi:hypothetical protein
MGGCYLRFLIITAPIPSSRQVVDELMGEEYKVGGQSIYELPSSRLDSEPKVLTTPDSLLQKRKPFSSPSLFHIGAVN